MVYRLPLILGCACAIGALAASGVAAPLAAGAQPNQAPLAKPAANARPSMVPDPKALLTPENIAKLEQGQSVTLKAEISDDSAGAGGGMVMTLVQRPKDVVWRYMLDYEVFGRNMPRVKDVKCYLNEPQHVGVTITARLIFRSVAQNLINTLDEQRGIVTWELDRSRKNDVRDARGAWMLLPHGPDKTIIVYNMQIDLGMRLPSALVNSMIKHDLPGFPEALKHYVESKSSAQSVVAMERK